MKIFYATHFRCSDMRKKKNLRYFTKIYSVHFTGSGPEGENFLRNAYGSILRYFTKIYSVHFAGSGPEGE